LAREPAFEILWILSEQRRLEVQKTLDTLTQTSDFNTSAGTTCASQRKVRFMCNPRRLTLLLFFTAVLWASLFGQQVPEISPRGYSVLSDFLRNQLKGQDFFRVGPKGAAIAPFTNAGLSIRL